jgi:hypothetical protein
LSVAQAQVLGILRDVYAFMYAFSIQTAALSAFLALNFMVHHHNLSRP